MNANKFMDSITLKQYSNAMYCYLLTNTTNGKSYVGITCNIKRRWADHKFNITVNACKDKPLYRAIAKHGSDAFDIKILSKKKTRQEISLDEIKYIKKYNTFIFPNKSGYNLTKGGENGWEARPATAKAKKNMSLSNIKRKAFKSLINFYKDNHDAYSKHSKEVWSRPGYKESRSGENHPMSKPLVLFGVKYNSIAEAAAKFGKSEAYPKYHAIPSKWNNINPKKHSNSYFL